MPQFDSEPTLTIRYTSSSGTNEYSFDGLTLISALTDASQVEVRWDVDVVYSGPSETGTSFGVDTLSSTIAEKIKTLVLDTHYTVNAETNEITLIPGAIADQPIVTASGTFYYPSSVTISSSQYLELRRSTDVTSKVVTFQPGSRLTAENLNLSTSQLFNAIQELTAFGVGSAGTVTDVDLSNNSINDLGDVTIDTGFTGLLQWNHLTQQVESGASVGGLVPAEGNSSTDGMALVSSFIFGGINSSPSYDWEWLTFDEVKSDKAGTSSLTDELNSITNSITPIATRTSGLSRPASPGPTTVNDGIIVPSGNIVATAGDVVATAGDVVIQNESVYDSLTRQKTWLASDPSWGMLTTEITGTGYRSLFYSSDFNAGSISYIGSLASSIEEVGGNSGLVVPRAMTVKIQLSGAQYSANSTTDPPPLGVYVTPHVNGSAYGTSLYCYRGDSNNIKQSSTTWVISLSANDKLDLRVFKNPSFTSASAFTYGSLFIEELSTS